MAEALGTLSHESDLGHTLNRDCFRLALFPRRRPAPPYFLASLSTHGTEHERPIQAIRGPVVSGAPLACLCP